MYNLFLFLVFLDFKDWIQDAMHERSRVSRLFSQKDDSWRSWFSVAYEGAQDWIIVFIVGM